MSEESEFKQWVDPDRLILTRDGELKMRDGSSVQEYLKRWNRELRKNGKFVQVIPVVIMT